MSKFRQLDENGDWTFGKGLNNYVKDNEEIKLNIKTRLLSWVGDCFFAQNDGIDWNNRLGNYGQKQNLEDEIRRIISQTPEVVEILSVDSILTNRNLSVSYSIKTIFNSLVYDAITT